MKLTKRFASIALPAAILLLSFTLLQAGIPGKFAGKAESPDMEKQAVTTYEALRAVVESGAELTAGEKLRYLELEALYADRGGRFDALDETGGPDGFGYLYVTNQDGDTASYNWIELRGDPQATWVNFPTSDDDVFEIPLGLNFPFYGDTYDALTLSTNGHLQFATAVTALTNYCLPYTNPDGPTIFPYWDDLHLNYGGNGVNTGNTVAYRNFGDYVVIEYDSIGHCCADGTSLKFETILYSNGRIKMQYNQIVLREDDVEDATIGIQADGDGPALEYVCNEIGSQPIDGLAILFYMGPTGTLQGHVEDDGGSPIAGAQVTVEELALLTETDGSGFYVFPQLPVGTYTMTASRHGYNPDTVPGVVVTAGQTITQDFELVSLGIVTFTSFDVPVAIVDNETITSTLAVTEDFPIIDIEVLVDITHTYCGDLEISIMSPGGTTILLSDRNGSGGDNYLNTVFDDDATVPIGDGDPPFNGTYIPDEPLGLLIGENVQGTWTLSIQDWAGGDTGSLNAWEIYVTPGSVEGGTLTGIVTDEDTEQPVPGIHVEIIGLGLPPRTTGPDGAYTFDYVPVGVYTVEFSGGLYNMHTETGVEIFDDQVTTLNVEISSDFLLYNYTGSEPINDNDTSYTVLHVDDDFEVEDARIMIGSITHTFDGDLSLWLESPEGTRVLLSAENGGSGDNYFETLFSDGATVSITDGDPPFTGEFLPEEPLAPLIGENTMGDWTLVVYDDAGGDTGTIDAWTLILLGDITPVGQLSGVIRSDATSVPIAFASVDVPDAGVSAIASMNGVYLLEIPVGQWDVVFSATFYCDSTMEDVVVEEGITTNLDARLLNPEAEADVTSLSVDIYIDQTTMESFDLENTGTCDLLYNIVDSLDWLSVSPEGGTLGPDESQTLEVTFDATGLGADTYVGVIYILHTADDGQLEIGVTMDVADAAGDLPGGLPTEFALHGNYPNPFNPSTQIRFDVPKASPVTMAIYNLLGQEVRTLLDGVFDAGRHAITWNGRDNRGLDVGTGVYLVRMKAGDAVFVGKMMLVR